MIFIKIYAEFWRHGSFDGTVSLSLGWSAHHFGPGWNISMTDDGVIFCHEKLYRHPWSPDVLTMSDSIVVLSDLYLCVLELVCMWATHAGNFRLNGDGIFTSRHEVRDVFFSRQRCWTDSHSHLRGACWKESDKISLIRKSLDHLTALRQPFVCNDSQIWGMWFSEGAHHLDVVVSKTRCI